MGAAVTVTKDNVESTIKDSDIVLLDFWAAWCGPCRFFAPIFEAAAADNPDIRFGRIDTEAERELAAAFQITSIPTLVAVRNRTVVFSQPGALPAAALADVIAQVRALDVEQLRQARGDAAYYPQEDADDVRLRLQLTGLVVHARHDGLMTVLTVIAVVAIVRGVRTGRSSSALDTLDERYARGEISSEEYQERKRQLAQH